MLSGWRERGLAAVGRGGPGAGRGAPRRSGPDGGGGRRRASRPDFSPAAVVLAVKPQSAAEALPPHARFAGKAVFLSIMAGRTIGGIAGLLGAEAAIVRAMPNTPAAVRQGVTVACAGPGVSVPQRSPVRPAAAGHRRGDLGRGRGVARPGHRRIRQRPGLRVPARRTAGAGGGGAGHSGRRWRALLARQTVAGSGALLAASPEDAAALRRAVTSPAGTTEAALKVLMAPDAWPAAMSRAIAAATARSRELAG